MWCPNCVSTYDSIWRRGALSGACHSSYSHDIRYQYPYAHFDLRRRRTAKQKLDMVGKLQKPGGLMRAVGPAAAARLMRIMTVTDPDMPLQDTA